MKNILEILEEYMLLEYNDKRQIQKNILLDYRLSDNIVARVYNGGLYIFFINSGTSIFFPESLYCIIHGLYSSRGKEILAINSVKKGDNISKFIILSNRLLFNIEKKVGLMEDDLIAKICETGSKGFVEYCNKRFNTWCSPISYKSLENNLIQL